MEAATSQGTDLSPDLRSLRVNYFEDFKFFLDNLARIGIELKSYPGRDRPAAQSVSFLLTTSNYLHLSVCAVKHRQLHLKHALRQCNGFLFHRMVSRVSLPPQPQDRDRDRDKEREADPVHVFDAYGPPHDPYNHNGHNSHSYGPSYGHSYGYADSDFYRGSSNGGGGGGEGMELSSLSAQEIAKLCPAAAFHSLHLPTQRTRDCVLRILRIVVLHLVPSSPLIYSDHLLAQEEECEVLPSKERCPYLVVVEVMAQPYPGSSPLLYSHGFEAMKELAKKTLQSAAAASPQSPSVPSAPQTTATDIAFIDDEYFNSQTSPAPGLGQGQGQGQGQGGGAGGSENVQAFARPDFGFVFGQPPPQPRAAPHSDSSVANPDGTDADRRSSSISSSTSSSSNGDFLRGGNAPYPSGDPPHHDPYWQRPHHSHQDSYSYNHPNQNQNQNQNDQNHQNPNDQWQHYGGHGAGQGAPQQPDYCEPTVLAHAPSHPSEFRAPDGSGQHSPHYLHPQQIFPYEDRDYRLAATDGHFGFDRQHLQVVPVRKKTWTERREIVRSMRSGWHPAFLFPLIH